MKLLKSYRNELLIILLIIPIFLFIMPLQSYYSDKNYVKNCINEQNFSLDKNLLIAISKVESGFCQQKISPKGAIGVFQIKQETFDYIKKLNGIDNLDINNPHDNIVAGCLYLEYLYKKFNDISLIIIAYNAGEGNVRLWLSDKNYSRDGKNIDYIPFNETRDYLKKVKFYYSFYTRFEKWKK